MPVSREARMDFERDGYVVLKSAVPADDILRLLAALESFHDSQASAGVRNLLNKSAQVKTFATGGIAFGIASEILGGKVIPVRAILFDKTPAANWYVTWHQDLSIPVANKIEIEGYGPWSVKDGIQHVQPPAEILAKMVSLRIHLDSCSETGGAIKFIAGSHSAGIFDPEQISILREQCAATICPADVGDVIAMRPLILHSSSASTHPEHRRVLHLEYASAQLPDGLNWAEA